MRVDRPVALSKFSELGRGVRVDENERERRTAGTDPPQPGQFHDERATERAQADDRDRRHRIVGTKMGLQDAGGERARGEFFRREEIQPELRCR